MANLKEYNVDKNNPVFKSVDSALLSKDGKILYSVPCKIGKEYTVPDGVETLSTGVFANARNMTINIPASVKCPPDYQRPHSYLASAFSNSCNIALNVSSKTEIRDYFEELPEYAEKRGNPGITVNFVD